MRLFFYIFHLLCGRFYNRKDYAEAVRRKRLEELTSEPLMTAIRCGMASVIPLQLLSVLTCQDLALRVCGRPDVNLDYLRVRHSTQHPIQLKCIHTFISSVLHAILVVLNSSSSMCSVFVL